MYALKILLIILLVSSPGRILSDDQVVVEKTAISPSSSSSSQQQQQPASKQTSSSTNAAADSSTLAASESGAASLSFVFDVTGSMYDDLVQVIEGAAKILATTLARREKPLANYVLVPFHDPDVGPVLQTTDPNKFHKHLRDLYVQGGGDCPEMAITAIKLALEVSLPFSFIYVFTDARAKDYYLTDSVLSLIQQKQSQVVFVMTGDCNDTNHPGFKAFEKIAATSSGQVFLLRKSEVNQVLNFVRVAIQTRKVNLVSVDTDPKRHKNVYTLPIDSKLQEITVSLSGGGAKLGIKNPQGKTVGVKNGLNVLLSLDNVFVANYYRPEPGIWRIQVVSDKPHTVRITGLSSLNFVYGFSKMPTSEFSVAVRRPVAGVPMHALINLTESIAPGQARTLEFVDLVGHVQLEAQLHPIGNSKTLYNASLTVPDIDFFYLRVVGTDPHGFEFRRTTQTAISAERAVKPITFMVPSIRATVENEIIVVNCQIYSLVPFSVRWIKDTHALGPAQQFQHSTNVTYRIESPNSLHEGVYTCNASNSAGYSASSTFLEIVDPPPEIVVEPNATATPGQTLQINCVVESVSSFVNVSWLDRYGVPIRNEGRYTVLGNGTLIIKDIYLSDEGDFICRAENEGGVKQKSVHVAVHRSPEVMITTDKETFVQGDHATLKCEATGYPLPKVYWHRGGKRIIESEKFSLSGPWLRIHEMAKTDAGEYTCIGENSAGKSSKTASFAYWEAPVILPHPDQISVAAGDRAILRCPVKGLPTPDLSWFKGDKPVVADGRRNIRTDGTLVLLDSVQTDAGPYICEAKNSVGFVQSKILLEVGLRPKILLQSGAASVEIGQNATIACAALGSPDPVIQWVRLVGASTSREAKLYQSSNVTVSTEPTLTLADVNLTDEGLYRCVAENRFGRDEHDIRVTVTGLMPPRISNRYPYIVAVEGGSSQLSCVLVYGNPKPEISWYKDGERLTVTDNIRFESVDNLHLLRFKSVRFNDFGEYVCEARNIGGMSRTSIVLEVQVPPKIIDSDLVDFAVVHGDSIILPCNVTGHPRPSVIWMQNGSPLAISNPHYYISPTGLEIFGASPSDDAWYECKAKNLAGEASKRLRLLVRVPPSMTLREEAYTVIVGHNVTLHCDATGIPPPVYSWAFNGRPVFGSNLPFAQLPNGHLVLFDVTTSVTGSYECTASNVAGNATKFIALAVFVPPLIQIRNDSELVAILGNTVLLDCTAAGIPIPRVSWRKNGKELINFQHDTMEVSSNGTLIIKSLSLSDAGLYTCVVDNAAGADTKDIQLVVHDPPKILQSAPINATAIENRRITLPCPVTGSPKPTIRWFKRDYEIFEGDPRIKVMPDGSLEFLQPVADDAGVYKCRATNVAGEALHKIELKVYVPPRFLKMTISDQGIEEITAIKNETVSFDCPVYAVPRAKINWYRSQIPIGTSVASLQHFSRYNISWDTQRLIIGQVIPEDQGEYSCSATNIAGQAQRTFKLNIFVPPSIKDKKASPANMSVIIESDLTINCPAEGIPKPQILWYKDNSLLFPGDVMFSLSGDSEQLQLRRAQLQSAGTYRCEVTNIAGAVSREYAVEVYVPPSIKNADEVSMFEIIVNNTMEFNCDAEGFPAPKITWFKNDQPLIWNMEPTPPPSILVAPVPPPPIDTSRHRFEADGRRLRIVRVIRGDSGAYACHASNAAGRLVKLFKLDVLVPPAIDTNAVVRNVTVIVNNSAVLRCPAAGHPQPEIVWYKDDEVLDPATDTNIKFSEDGQKLEIQNTRITDTATYQCVVANKAGQDRLALELDIFVPAAIDSAEIDKKPRVVVNKSLTISCPATGIPPPKIIWLKDGAVLLPSLSISQTPVLHRARSLMADSGRHLEIASATVDDAGLYTCRAENQAGTAEVNYQLQVLVPPRIDRSANKTVVQVVVNRSTAMECFASGIPRPSITWFRNGLPFDLTKSLAVSVEPNKHENSPFVDVSTIGNKLGLRWTLKADGQILEVNTASVSDAARYGCVATNDAGSAERLFDLDVLVPPNISLQNVDLEPKVVKGRVALLNCPAVGIPVPVISWFKNDEPVKPEGRHQILSGGRQLEMSTAVESDAGIYICIAQNEAGVDKIAVTLRILVPPNMQVDNLVDRPRIVVNRTVILECPADGVPPPEIKWLRNGFPLKVDDHMKLTTDGQQLEIQRVRESDSARFTCLATNEAGQITRNYDLEVLLPPMLEIMEPADGYKVIENRSLSLNCRASGTPPPMLLWFHDRQDLSEIQDDNYDIASNGTRLNIKRVRVKDGGTFTCQATNVAGQEEYNFEVEVLVPPVIHGIESELKVNVNRSVTIHCPVTGKPEPSIIWYKDGIPISAKNGVVKMAENGRKILLTSAQVPDGGNYRCVAKNEAGSTEKEYHLTVLVPPFFAPNLSPSKLHVIINRPAKITCAAVGIPPPTIAWFHNSQPIGPALHVTLGGASPNVRFEGDGQVLKLDSAQLVNSGRYSCTARNAAGNNTAEFYLAVWIPPSIKEGPSMITTVTGSKAILPCDVIGLPQPNVTWSKDGKVALPNGIDVNQLISGSMEFLSPQVKDSGNYTCFVSNSAGNVSKQIEFRVFVPAFIHNKSKETVVKVINSQPALLPCNATGVPPPRITWQRGTDLLQSGPEYSILSNGSLFINQSMLHDNGVYICIAQNEAGTALAQVKLSIQIPPTVKADRRDFTVIQDEEVLLPCQGAGVPQPTISWNKDGQSILQSDFRYRVLPSGWLAIPVTRTEDSGTYGCIVENEAGRVSLNITLNVLVPAKIRPQENVLAVTEGSSVQLECPATGVPRPTVSWAKDGIPVRFSSFNYHQANFPPMFSSGTTPKDLRGAPPGIRVVIDNEWNTLTIKYAEANDTGVYTCTAANTAGQDQTDIVLRVHVKPTLLTKPFDREVVAGERVELDCTAHGLPTPLIVWKFNGAAIPSNFNSDGYSRLVIDHVTKYDAGTYECIAENPAGRATSMANVVVKIPPRVLLPPMPMAVSVKESIILHCDAKGEPSPTVIWTKDGIPLGPNSDGRIEFTQEGSLIIHESDLADSGEYRCVASNDVGISEAAAKLTVKSIPTFAITPPADMQIDTGDRILLNCMADGNPTPIIYWEKDNYPIESDGKRQAIFDNNTLEISDAESIDSGVYTCYAKNGVGTISTHARLLVRINGGWSDWAQWSECSMSCGNGTKIRRRFCNNPIPANGGRECVGSDSNVEPCNERPCPIDGRWSEWSNWTDCSVSCGEGARQRFRTCDNPKPEHGGRSCFGDDVEIAICRFENCPVDGGWSAWLPWQPCSTTCGNGTQSRMRICDSPPPLFGGHDCSGAASEIRVCSTTACPIHGHWSEWSPWSTCSVSCGGGTRERKRSCNSPEPGNGGRLCPGKDVQIDYCNSHPCPVHGHWSAWTSWGDCSASCGGNGLRKRFRTCDNPKPAHGGRDCTGPSEQMDSCAAEPCPVDGAWGPWGAWSPCTQSCAGGMRTRRRNCTQPKFGGSCVGDAEQATVCNIHRCNSPLPQAAVGTISGRINDDQLDAGLQLSANFTEQTATGEEGASLVEGVVRGVSKKLSSAFQVVVNLLTPLYWMAAGQKNKAANGFYLTRGHFNHSATAEFASGEIFRANISSEGVDENGQLVINLVLDGNIPQSAGNAPSIKLHPLREKLVQTAPGELYSTYSHVLQIGEHVVPYSKVQTINYDPSARPMPFLTESLNLVNWTTDVDAEDGVHFAAVASVNRGHDGIAQCPPGFLLEDNGPYCKDVDECDIYLPCPNMPCFNLPGTYYCGCPIGFYLTADRRSCIDVDECATGVAQCHYRQQCQNTIGSYRCIAQCPLGFQLASNGVDCQDVDECAEVVGGLRRDVICAHNCHNMVGSFRCSCRTGYRLVNRTQCEDIDECNLGLATCSHECTNTPGSYKCNCPIGYKLGESGSCVDLDECDSPNYQCSETERCINTHGSFKCLQRCQTGFEPSQTDPTKCVDADECASNSHSCHPTQICLNTVGSYACYCASGARTLPGQSCNGAAKETKLLRTAQQLELRDEVLPMLRRRPNMGLSGHLAQLLSLSSKPCFSTPQQPCDNGVDYYDTGRADVFPWSEVFCDEGYRPLRGNCVDIDECLNPGQCQHHCYNTPGSFYCSCPPGYRLSGNRRTCEDVDECDELRVDCGPEQMCFNRRGDYVCISDACPRGYDRRLTGSADSVVRSCVRNCDPRRVDACPDSLLPESPDIIQTRTVALPRGLPANQDLIRLSSFNASQTTFSLAAAGTPFAVRTENGEAVVYSTIGLDQPGQYVVRVTAKSTDTTAANSLHSVKIAEQRQAAISSVVTFIINIAISEYPF